MFAFFFLIKTKRALQAAVTKITLTMEGRVDPYLNYLNSWLKELTPAISIWYSNILIQDIIKKKIFFLNTYLAEANQRRSVDSGERKQNCKNFLFANFEVSHT